ncbi:uncharacterized protein K02A2.6-like, partial [Ceratina calcarata]|uniref:RNA-directed DNA polymerase n=1 Tax=Ceratina calcarata TaxID=156304 RepID=A0AAJ7J319_9HYME
MEIDSGAAMSIISVATKDQYFKNVKLHDADITLRNHDETPYIPVGMLRRVKVEANGTTMLADVYVTKSNGPAIIGRPWLKALNLWPLFKEVKVHAIESKSTPTETLKTILKKYESVFSSGKGSFTKGAVKLELKPGSKPIFLLARSVPFAMKEKLEKELVRLEKLGIIKHVENSEWATPIVPVIKPNGDIRMCADFKQTINQQLITVIHPAPNFDHAMAQLQGGDRYSKIDLKEAYLQMPVDEESQPLLTINTHKGLFQYKYMAFGISSAPGIFQMRMEQILKGIPHVAIVVDDVVVTGKDSKEHLQNLEKVLAKLDECGLKVRVDKCQFFKQEITYLGYRICKNKISIDPMKYQAIVEMKKPANKKELQLLLGLAAYISHPYKDGEKPIAFASKRLTKAQEGYSQIDREAAAIIFGITRFYDYVYAREFILRTDNKPLARILGPEK